ncbi:MAG: zinc ribbon domain-containing protein [Acholeplasmatales bacterium]|nr:zinc ribbon domain-containing protein [Acholeplasmatales bacterium]
MDKNKCPKCGNELEDNTVFCKICGESILRNHEIITKGKVEKPNKSFVEKASDELLVKSFIFFLVLLPMSIVFLAFGIVMAAIGAKVWLVILIFVLTIACLVVGILNLKYYLKHK